MPRRTPLRRNHERNAIIYIFPPEHYKEKKSQHNQYSHLHIIRTNTKHLVPLHYLSRRFFVSYQLPRDDLQRLGVRRHDELLLAFDGLRVISEGLGQLHLDRASPSHHLTATHTRRMPYGTMSTRKTKMSFQRETFGDLFRGSVHIGTHKIHT